MCNGSLKTSQMIFKTLEIFDIWYVDMQVLKSSLLKYIGRVQMWMVSLTLINI